MAEPTAQQMRAALAEKRLKDSMKRIELSAHFERVNLVPVVGLPYKIITEHNKGDCKTDAFITEFYPGRKPDAVQFRSWLEITYPDVFASVCSSPAAWLGWAYSPDKASKRDADGKPIVDFATCQSDAYTALEQEFHISRRGFKDDNERRHLFGHFLDGYDLDSFSVFDLYGSKDHGAEEVERFRGDLKRLQADYIEHPNNYYNPMQAAASTADDLIGIDAASTADGIGG